MEQEEENICNITIGKFEDNHENVRTPLSSETNSPIKEKVSQKEIEEDLSLVVKN